MKKRLISLILTLLSTLFALCSCGMTAHTPISMTYESMITETNAPIFVPPRAEKIQYYVTNLDEKHKASKVTCIIDGDDLQILACKVEPDYPLDYVHPLMKEYWSLNGNPLVNGYSAIVKATTDGTGYIIWKDDSDILYSICILKNTSHSARDNFAVEVSASEKLVQLGEEICLGLESWEPAKS